MTNNEFEGNKILSEFMGTCGLEKEGVPNAGIVRNAAKYHTSYNWLMKVWVKFRDLKINDKMLLHYHKQVCASFGNGILNSDIKQAFYDAVMAIKWYNTTIKTTE